jgi:hypothetical protein
MDELFTDMD